MITLITFLAVSFIIGLIALQNGVNEITKPVVITDNFSAVMTLLPLICGVLITACSFMALIFLGLTYCLKYLP